MKIDYRSIIVALTCAVTLFAPAYTKAQTNPPLSQEEKEAYGLPYTYVDPNDPMADFMYTHTGNPIIDLASDPQALQLGAREAIAADGVALAGAGVALEIGAASVSAFTAIELVGEHLPVIGEYVGDVLTIFETIGEIAEGGTIKAAVEATADAVISTVKDLLVDFFIVDPAKEYIEDKYVDPIIDTAKGDPKDEM